MIKSVYRFLIVATVVGGAPLLQAAELADVNLEVKLNVAKSYAQGDSVPVGFDLTNVGSRPVRVLKWGTPLEGFSGHFFRITRNGDPIPYVGPHAIRAEPRASSYVEIPAGDTVSSEVNLADAYSFGDSGDYEISFVGQLHDVIEGAQQQTRLMADFRRVSIDSGPYPFRIEQGVHKAVPSATSGAFGVTFNQCSAAQEKSLTAALNKVETDAPGVASDVAAATSSTWPWHHPLLVGFFGAYNSSRAATAEYVTAGVETSSASNVNFDCSGGSTYCGTPTYCADHKRVIAFTCYSPDIFICPLYDSQSSYTDDHVVYHEMAHWYSTIDHTYGCSGSWDLAQSKPADAVANADNYAWFAELFVGKKVNCGGVEHFLFTFPLIGMLTLFMGGLSRRRCLKT